MLRRFISASRRVVYSSNSTSEAWLSLAITAAGWTAVTGVAYYHAVPAFPYLVGGLTLAAAVHVRNGFKLSARKAVEISVGESGDLEIILVNGTALASSTAGLQLAEEAEFPNDFKLLRLATTSSGEAFYVSYNAEMTAEGRRLLKMP